MKSKAATLSIVRVIPGESLLSRSGADGSLSERTASLLIEAQALFDASSWLGAAARSICGLVYRSCGDLSPAQKAEIFKALLNSVGDLDVLGRRQPPTWEVRVRYGNVRVDGTAWVPVASEGNDPRAWVEVSIEDKLWLFDPQTLIYFGVQNDGTDPAQLSCRMSGIKITYAATASLG